jgi:Flp pilus assembly protein TadD
VRATYLLFIGIVVLSVVAIAGCQKPQSKAFQQGALALEKGDFVLAVICFTEAIRLDPKDAKA